MPNLLDAARRTLKRAHATPMDNVPGIIMGGLRPGGPEERYHGNLRPINWTTAENRLDNTFYIDGAGRRNALIRYRIPKEWHKRHVMPNPSYNDYAIKKDEFGQESYDQHSFERKHTDTALGGRVSTYDSTIPPEFIEEVCFGPNAEWCYDPEELERHIAVDHTNRENPFIWEDFFYPRAQDIFEKYGRK